MATPYVPAASPPAPRVRTAASSVLAAPAPIRVLGLVGTFTGHPLPDLAQITNELYGDGPWSARDILTDISGGHQTIPAQDLQGVGVVGSLPSPNCLDDWLGWASSAEQNLVASGRSIGDATNVMTFVPNDANCTFAGIAFVRGTRSLATTPTWGHVIAHEIIHNLGVEHAGALRCRAGGTTVMLGNDAECELSEYGDPFSIMGPATSQMPPNVAHKVQLGWLPADALPLVTADATLTIRAQNVAGPGPYGLRLLLPGGRVGFIDTWRPRGSGTFGSGSAVSTGVSVRVMSNPKYYGGATRLLDAHPATTAFEDAPIQPGEQREVGAGGPRIEVLSSAEETSTVRITGVIPDLAPPSAPVITDLEADASARSVRLHWTPSEDDLEMGGYRILRDGVMVAEVGDASGHVDTSAPFDGAPLTYRVVAIDRAGNAVPSAPRTITPPDLTPPGVPGGLRGEVTGDRDVRVTWNVSPGATRYRLSRDAQSHAFVTEPVFVDRALPPGIHRYTVTAIDGTGNESAAALIEVTVASTGGAGRATNPNPADTASGTTTTDTTSATTPVRAASWSRLRLGRGRLAGTVRVTTRGVLAVRVRVGGRVVRLTLRARRPGVVSFAVPGVPARGRVTVSVTFAPTRGAMSRLTRIVRRS